MSDFNAALVSLQSRANHIFIIGGSQVYSLALQHPHLGYIFETKVDSSVPCDTFFPTIPAEFHRIEANEIKDAIGFPVPKGKQNQNGIEFEFTALENRNMKV
jgi:dihydrofolate reductase